MEGVTGSNHKNNDIMSDFTRDLVGANKVEIVDEDGKVIRTETLGKSKPSNPSNQSQSQSKPKSITMSYIKWALVGELIAVGGISYYVISTVLPSISRTYLFGSIAVIAIILASLLWYGMGKFKKWAWWTAVILLIISIPLDFLLLSIATIGLLIYGILVLYYLRRKEVKMYFGLKG